MATMTLMTESHFQFPTFVFVRNRSQAAENFILRTKDFLKNNWGGGFLKWYDEEDDNDDNADDKGQASKLNIWGKLLLSVGVSSWLSFDDDDDGGDDGEHGDNDDDDHHHHAKAQKQVVHRRKTAFVSWRQRAVTASALIWQLLQWWRYGDDMDDDVGSASFYIY